jgi:DNA-binding transcriptional LysR family regulator
MHRYNIHMQNVHLGDINLNLLAVLDALLAERSVTRAAAHLGLSQSATSHALRRLREMFDDPLLVRGSAGLVPTALAEELAGPVRSGLLTLARAVRGELRFDPATAKRTFTVATVDHPLLTGLPRFLATAAADAPGIDLHVRPFGDELARRLEAGEIDVVLAGAEAEMVLALDKGLMRSRVIREGFVCVTRPDHPALKARALDLETFAALPHLLVSTTGAGPGIVDTALAQHGLERRIAVRIPYFSGAPLLLAQSDMIATLPRSMAEAGQRIAPLALHTPPLDLPRSDAFLWWHERFQRDPGHAWFRQALLAAFAPYRY